MGKVVDIGDLRISNLEKQRQDKCKHLHLTLDENGEIVTCDDCKRQISPYYALRLLVDQWHRKDEDIKSARQKIEQSAQETLFHRAALKVQEAWRRRSMVPSCPHCHRGILPTDGFGGSSVNRDMELRRRAVEKAKPKVLP